ncbi:MAG: hypothetical protein EOO78_32380, partial [Oxalobacteraceae bacterium]
VGSRDFQRDQYDHVAQAERQPGSTFKPFVYGAALERGFEPDRMYADGPVEIRLGDGRFWRPMDMGGASGRQMSLRDGLVYSKNTITAQVMQDVGVNDIVTLARAAGVNRSRLDAVPSLALGTSPVTLLEMVSSYGTIARGGEYREPIFIRSIKDREGKTLVEFSKPPVRVMSERTSTELIDMMRGVVSRGTGTAMKSRFQVAADIAGKTGTTQNNTDGWFILMHPNLVVGSWVGFNDARVTMRSDYWGQGGHNALLLVGDFFRAAVVTTSPWSSIIAGGGAGRAVAASSADDQRQYRGAALRRGRRLGRRQPGRSHGGHGACPQRRGSGCHHGGHGARPGDRRPHGGAQRGRLWQCNPGSHVGCFGRRRHGFRGRTGFAALKD